MVIHFTRCPQCRTTFRITSQQLALREGRARCGHCQTVFNAFAALVNFRGERVPGPGMEPVQRETMTLRDSVSSPESDFSVMSASSTLSEITAKKTMLPPTPEFETVDDAPPIAVTHEKRVPLSISTEDFALEIEESTEEKQLRRRAFRKEKPSPLTLVLDPAKKPTIWQRLRLPSWCRPLFYLFSLSALTALLAAQAVFFLHDELANAHPKLTPALSQGCRWLQCEIRPLQNLDALTIEASDLQSDPYNPQQLLLTITLRNRSNKPVAYPRLSLELTDSQSRPLARQFFAPEAYLVRATDADIGAPAARDLVLRLLLRSEFIASGYRLSLVY